jgi:hypothetical protein
MGRLIKGFYPFSLRLLHGDATLHAEVKEFAYSNGASIRDFFSLTRSYRAVTVFTAF